MQLALYRHLWGIDEAWETTLPKIAALNLYKGIECPLPWNQDRGRWTDLLAKHNFAYLAMGFTGGATPAEHLVSLRDQARTAKELGAKIINVHSGSDTWTLQTGIDFFKEAVKIGRDSGITVLHETHRSRILFNPRDTRFILEAVPELHLAADFSHWTVVTGRLMDAQDQLSLAISRTRHIHARVGYDNGPQVPDPRAPESAQPLAAHEGWWDAMWDAMTAAGVAETTLTPEFGPPSYMHTLPFTNVPVANLWDICNWQAQRQGERFAKRQARATAKS